MKGYVRQRRGRFYAVIYEGRDPVTGKERRAPGTPPAPIAPKLNGAPPGWPPQRPNESTGCGR